MLQTVKIAINSTRVKDNGTKMETYCYKNNSRIYWTLPIHQERVNARIKSYNFCSMFTVSNSVYGNSTFKVTWTKSAGWEQIPPDLTTNDKSKQKSSGEAITQENTSEEYYCTIFTATENAMEKDLLCTETNSKYTLRFPLLFRPTISSIMC